MRSSIPDLPEEILFLIHCLMPMRDAARAACASRAFLHSWRFHPNLIFNEDTIGLKINGRGENFHHKVGRILRKHSGIGLKTFNLDYSNMCGFDGSRYFDSWLQIALKPGIEKLTLWLPTTKKKNTTSHAHFYQMGFETHFSIFNFIMLPSIPLLNLAP